MDNNDENRFYTDPKIQKSREQLLDEMSNKLHNDANKSNKQFWIMVAIAAIVFGGLTLCYFLI
jgi:hypothetical protein